MGTRRLATGLAALAFAGVTAAASAGPLDGGFGGDGVVTGGYQTAISGGDAVTVDDEQRVVVAGFADGQVGVARRRENGTSDRDFGVDGAVAVDVGVTGARLDRVADVEVQTGGDESVVTAFDLRGSTGLDIGLLRLTPAGGRDPAFGGDGIVALELGASASVADIAVDSASRIWIAGDAESEAGDRDAFTTRLLPDGSPDATYGTGGVAIVERPGDQRITDSVLVRGSHLVLGGIDVLRPAAIQLDESGAREWVGDVGARASGPVQLAVPGRDHVLVASGGKVLKIAAFDEDGKTNREVLGGLARVRMPVPATLAGIELGEETVVVGGSIAARAGDRPFAAAVRVASGELDPAFARRGIAISRRAITVSDMDLDRRRRVVVSGSTTSSIDTSSYALARFKPAP